MIRMLFLILFFLSTAIYFAQQSDYERIKKEYDSFEYENVIKFSDEIIKQKNLPDSLLIDIYLMRAVSFYSLGKEDSTKENFRDILKIKNDYNADPAKISPKLIALFEQVKVNFINQLKSQTTVQDTLQTQLTKKYFDYRLVGNSLIRNMILPGVGQFYIGLKTKGLILGTVSAFNLIGLFYYVHDTNKKEKDYLNEYDPILIQKKYDLYNKSYKVRNALIISYALLWIYSQLDLLFFNDNNAFMSEIKTAGGSLEVSKERINFSIYVPLSY